MLPLNWKCLIIEFPIVIEASIKDCSRSGAHDHQGSCHFLTSLVAQRGLLYCIVCLFVINRIKDCLSLYMRVLVQPLIGEPFSPGLGWPKSLTPQRSLARGRKKFLFYWYRKGNFFYPFSSRRVCWKGETRSFNLFVLFFSLSVKVIMYNL